AVELEGRQVGGPLVPKEALGRLLDRLGQPGGTARERPRAPVPDQEHLRPLGRRAVDDERETGPPGRRSSSCSPRSSCPPGPIAEAYPGDPALSTTGTRRLAEPCDAADVD